MLPMSTDEQFNKLQPYILLLENDTEYAFSIQRILKKYCRIDHVTTEAERVSEEVCKWLN